MIDYAWASSVNTESNGHLMSPSIATFALKKWTDTFHRCADLAQLAWGIIELFCHIPHSDHDDTRFGRIAPDVAPASLYIAGSRL
jgi:hypothetical protein